MAITIQELLSSDTISQAVDKINFNFDQLLLNGGGPAGPAGPAGPIGPIGGRGEKGTTWYKDTTGIPGIDPNTIIIPGLNENDYFLQSDGTIWEWDGVQWINTGINLTGPIGPAGPGIGFVYAGGFPGSASIDNENIAYVSPMPSGINGGAAAWNQGISAVLLGGVASNVTPPSGVTINDAFKLTESMTRSIDSSLVSVLINQKDSGSSAIRFIGGGVESSDKYERNDLLKLSNITLGVDDALNINVPKAATSPSTSADFIGFNVNTLHRGQRYFAGKQIEFISGASTHSGNSDEISDIIFNINSSNPNNIANLTVNVLNPNQTISGKLKLGGRITIPQSTQADGRYLVEAGEIGIIGQTIRLQRSASNRIVIDSTGLNLTGRTRLITQPESNNDSTPQVLVRKSGTGEIETTTFPVIPQQFPCGGIIMWSGSVANLPSGWVLCNGQTVNGVMTPDLRGRFIVGYNPFNTDYNQVGKTGGQDTVTLTINQLPSHSHTLAANIFTQSPLQSSTDFLARGRDGSGASLNHGLARTNIQPTVGRVGITGGNQPHENRPPYYVLAFIMFIGNCDGSTPVPSPEPSPAPSPEPSPAPSPEPSPAPSPEPSPVPIPIGGGGAGGGESDVQPPDDTPSME